MTEHLPYRRCAGVTLINAQGLVFIGQRKKERDALPASGHEWQMPQGGIDADESSWEEIRKGVKQYDDSHRDGAESVNVASIWQPDVAAVHNAHCGAALPA